MPLINKTFDIDNKASRDILGIEYKRSTKELLTETAQSLIKVGILESKTI